MCFHFIYKCLPIYINTIISEQQKKRRQIKNEIHAHKNNNINHCSNRIDDKHIRPIIQFEYILELRSPHSIHRNHNRQLRNIKISAKIHDGIRGNLMDQETIDKIEQIIKKNPWMTKIIEETDTTTQFDILDSIQQQIDTNNLSIEDATEKTLLFIKDIREKHIIHVF